MEIYPGLHRIATVFPPNNHWLYLLRGSKAAILVDSGCKDTPGEVIYPYLAEICLAPEALTHLIITHAHADHFGGNAAVKARSPGVQILAHTLEVPYAESVDRLVQEWYQGQFVRVHGFGFPDSICNWMRGFIGPDVKVDVALQGGDRIDLGDGWQIEVVHTPGHMPGHITLWDAAHRCAIMGDALLGRGVPGRDGVIHSPAPYFEVEPYLQAVAAVEALKPELILSAHYPDLRGDAVPAFLADCRAFVDDCNNAILDTLAEAAGPVDLRQVIRGVDAHLGPYADPEVAWLAPINGHMRYLEAQRAVQVADVGRPRRWTRR